MWRGVGWIDRVVLGEPTDFVFMIGVTLLEMKRFLRNVGFTYHALRRHDIENNARTSCILRFVENYRVFPEYLGFPSLCYGECSRRAGNVDTATDSAKMDFDSQIVPLTNLKKCEACSFMCSIYATLKAPLYNDSEPILILRPLPKNMVYFHAHI